MKRLLTIWRARNQEFLRDRGALLTTVALPFLAVVAMAVVLGGPERAIFKVGLMAAPPGEKAHPFLSERYVDFVRIDATSIGMRQVTRQDIDLLVDFRTKLPRYWVNTDSPKGYIVEKLLLAAEPTAARQPVMGAARRYVEWLFPGVLGINMMFNCLFDGGFAVLRYRSTGFLKRLHATPLTAFEFLTAQILSRLSLSMFVIVTLYVGISALFHFHCVGSIGALLLIATLGCLSMIALGLVVAARFASHEIVGIMLNLLTWSMMVLSGVWFSLEGSPQWVRVVAQLFPLTHVLEASRAVMFDGADLAQIAPNVIYLAGTMFVFLALGAWIFRWNVE